MSSKRHCCLAYVKYEHFITVLSASEFHNFGVIRMAAKCNLEEDEIKKHFMWIQILIALLKIKCTVHLIDVTKTNCIMRFINHHHSAVIVIIVRTPITAWQEGVNNLSNGAVEINHNEAPHVNKDYT
jgi:hypothetical protein